MTPERWQRLVDALEERDITHWLVRRPHAGGVALHVEVMLPIGGRLVVADKYRGAQSLGWEVYVRRRHGIVRPVLWCSTQVSEVVQAIELVAKEGPL